jgi:hypothetical protein
MSTPSILVATPCYGGLATSHYVAALLRLQAHCLEIGIGFDVSLLGNDALITRARNKLVANFLAQPRFTHLLFIDADIGFDPAQVMRMLAFDRDVVGGVYPTKGIDWAQVKALSGTLPADRLEAASQNYVIGLSPEGAPDVVDEFARVPYLGTGLLLVKRGVFERFIAAYPQLRYRPVANAAHSALETSGHFHLFFDAIIDPVTQGYLPEDWTFCRRCGEIGIEIWADLRSKLTHVGTHAFIGDYMGFLEARAASLPEDAGGT